MYVVFIQQKYNDIAELYGVFLIGYHILDWSNSLLIYFW